MKAEKHLLFFYQLLPILSDGIILSNRTLVSHYGDLSETHGLQGLNHAELKVVLNEQMRIMALGLPIDREGS